MIGLTPKMRNNNLIHILIMELALILERNQEKREEISAFIALYNYQKYKLENSTFKVKIDLLQILTTSIQKINTKNLTDFLLIIQLDVEQLETNKQVMNRSHTQQWIYVIKNKFDQLEKNKTWILIPDQEVEQSYKPFSEKQVFKDNKDVNEAITRFKA